jgi:hypothetical protein
MSLATEKDALFQTHVPLFRDSISVPAPLVVLGYSWAEHHPWALYHCFSFSGENIEGTSTLFGVMKWRLHLGFFNYSVKHATSHPIYIVWKVANIALERNECVIFEKLHMSVYCLHLKSILAHRQFNSKLFSKQ